MPNCDHIENLVVDSRPGEYGVRRRRECSECGYRWTTIEIAFDEDSKPGQNPWVLYRRAAIRNWLTQQLVVVDYE